MHRVRGWSIAGLLRPARRRVEPGEPEAAVLRELAALPIWDQQVVWCSDIIAAMMLGLIGDVEGEREAALDCLSRLGQRGDVAVACQLGDLRFGYGSDPEGYLDAIETPCAEYEIELLGITGNTRTGRSSTRCGRTRHGRTRTARVAR